MLYGEAPSLVGPPVTGLAGSANERRIGSRTIATLSRYPMTLGLVFEELYEGLYLAAFGCYRRAIGAVRCESKETLVKHLFATAILTVALTGGAVSAHADGDVQAGEKTFKSSCSRCHTIEEGGKDKVGPNLFGVFGATAGTRVASFEKRHSKTMKESGVVWDEETLDEFLANPKEFMPKNRMTFPGVKDEHDREDLIAYLKTAK